MQVEILTPAIASPTGLPRSHGIHVSAVIRTIAVMNKTLKPEYVESLDLIDRSGEDFWEKIDPVAKLRMSMGLAWEHYYINNQLPDVVHQPGEMCIEGIYMTHDGEGLETVLSERGEDRMVLALHEVKLTYKSWNTVKNLSAQWMWLAQMKAYCKGLETLRAHLHVLCVAGDYSYPITPLARIFDVTFTQAEIDENWDILTSYVRHRHQQEAEDFMRGTDE